MNITELIEKLQACPNQYAKVDGMTKTGHYGDVVDVEVDDAFTVTIKAR